MNTSPFSLASYATSALLTLKGWYEHLTTAVSAMPLESKIGVMLGIGTFVVNYYWQRRRTRAIEILTEKGDLASALKKDEE